MSCGHSSMLQRCNNPIDVVMQCLMALQWLRRNAQEVLVGGWKFDAQQIDTSSQDAIISNGTVTMMTKMVRQISRKGLARNSPRVGICKHETLVIIPKLKLSRPASLKWSFPSPSPLPILRQHCAKCQQVISQTLISLRVTQEVERYRMNSPSASAGLTLTAKSSHARNLELGKNLNACASTNA